jgi:hypothetical protein
VGTKAWKTQEVCARHIYTKLHDIHYQYNLLEPMHGTNPKIMFLVESHTIYGMVPKTSMKGT